MFDIELVIKLPREQYSLIKQSHRPGVARFVDKEGMMYAIKNGKILYKGHGRLIDADELFDKIQFADFSNSDDVNTALCSIGDAPTIIEADKAHTEVREMTKEEELDILWNRCQKDDKSYEAYCVLRSNLKSVEKVPKKVRYAMNETTYITVTTDGTRGSEYK